jgi:hypothetical protein
VVNFHGIVTCRIQMSECLAYNAPRGISATEATSLNETNSFYLLPLPVKNSKLLTGSMVCELWDSNEVLVDNHMMTPPHRTARFTTGKSLRQSPNFSSWRMRGIDSLPLPGTCPRRRPLCSLIREEIISQFHDSYYPVRVRS